MSARRLIAASRSAIRARTADRDAMIGVMVLGLMLLLAATSLAIFVTLNASIAATRQSRDFVRANEHLDTAEADVTYALNATPGVGSGAGVGEGDAHYTPSRWSWTKTINPTYGPYGGGQVTMRAQVNSIDQSRTRPWRLRQVGSQTGTATEPIYGVAAPSAWLAAVSSEDDSWVRGTVTGDWHAYGVGQIRVEPGSSVDRVISYDKRAHLAPGTDVEFVRSNLTATLDEHLVNDRVTACGSNLKRYRSSTNPAGPILNAGQLSCYYTVDIDVPTTITGLGTANVISYGDIHINANISTVGGNQLHLYTASGTVTFRNGPHVSAYIFAPNALCKNYDAATVTYNGSLACRQVQMTANFTTGATLPLPDGGGVGVPTTSVSYLEFPGYRDRFGN